MRRLGEAVVAARIAAVVQRDEAREDGIGGAAADLLRGDGLREVAEGRGAGLGAQPIGAYGLDQGGHHRIGAAEVRQQRASVDHFWHAGHQ